MSKTQRRRRLRRRQIASQHRGLTARSTAVAITGSLLTAAGLATAPSAVAADSDVTLVADLTPGAVGTDIRNATAAGSKLFFLQNTAASGTELWVSDGTPTGTQMVEEIAADGEGSYPRSLTAVGSQLFFTADDGSSRGLWRSDGTAVGTAPVTGPAPDSTVDNLVAVGSELFFTSDPDDASLGHELWKTNGTTSSKITDLAEASYDGYDTRAAAGGTLYFVHDDRTRGRELWKSDGTAAGTGIVADLRPAGDDGFDFEGSQPKSLTAAGSTLFFTADDGTNGRELWKTDGTESGTTPLTENESYYGGLQELTAVGTSLFFTNHDDTNGRELWRSDGTAAGTGLVADIRPNDLGYPYGSKPLELTAVGSTLFFTADDGTRGRELWKSNGTDAGATLVADISDSDSEYGYPNRLTTAGSTLFFTADDGISGRDLWKSDGSTAGTGLVADPEDTDAPGDLVATTDRLFFELDETTTGRELWTAPLTASIKPPVVNQSAPVISGTPVVGGRLTASTGTWTPATGTYVYQWFADGERVFRANRSTFRPGSGEVGAQISVRVLAESPGFRTIAARSAETAPVAEESIVNEARPTITGTARVGSVLTASRGTWSQSDLTYTYQWSVGGTPVEGATGTTFAVPDTAVGKTVTVSVTASAPELAPATATSAPTSAVAAGVLTLTRKPAVSGQAKVGKTLRVAPGAVTPGATWLTFQWLRNGKVIAGAATSTYKLTAKDKGKKVSSRVTYTRAGYTPLRATTAATATVKR